MKRLYIVGAGGCGRELLSMLLNTGSGSGKYTIAGFLDDTDNPLQGKACDRDVVGTIQGYIPHENDILLMGIADPHAKARLVPMLKEKGAQFTSFIHPGASVGRNNIIGEGVVIYGGMGMTVNVSIGDFATLQACYLGHDVTIGKYSTISSFCNIMGYASIEERVFLGSNVAVKPKAIIHKDAYICMGSVIIKDVNERTKVIGNPAREIGIYEHKEFLE